ncbi:hypothetical protein TEA_027335 [Camellia sinensis var. sinensis]|uniref:Uncharacterized protein n=1 Tax=Camellia sinensis var. sinensis TaxID=542762 RepID=A0A4S4ENR6_CAMSN|nr:hypothetical protein TEA_027335 [Camellia sinensis var. sinensis]
MSKRKFGFEGFGINRQTTYNFERSQPPQRLYVPPSSRSGGHDNYEDTDLDNIDYDDREPSNAADEGGDGGGDDEIDPLDAFMEGIHEEMKAAQPPKVNEKLEKYSDDEDDDPMESFLKAKKDVGLTLASDVLHAGYDSDEEVYAAAKAVDAGMVEYDSDDNPIVLGKNKIEPIPALDHSSIEYEPINKDFYEETPSISGMSEQDVVEYRNSLAIRVSGFDVPRPIKTFEEGELVNSLIAAGQNVSAELMDLAMKDGRFRSKRDARKGGGKRAKGRGGGSSGRGVRGVDFGLGIGYSADSNNTSSSTVPNRSVAVGSLRTGMMAQFKSKFVSASSNSQNQGMNNNSSGTYANKRMVLPGFVSGGSIGGDVNAAWTTNVSAPPPAPMSGGNPTNQSSMENANASQKNSESSRDKPRERRRSSGWDR